MSYDTMLTKLEANGVIEMPIQFAADMRDLDDRIKNGDNAGSGWRGDPSMGIFVDRKTGKFEIWGIDRGGNEYLAASHKYLDANVLLRKLEQGDPLRHDVIGNVLAHNARLEATRKAHNDDLKGELGEKVQWAIRRDLHNGRGAHTAIPRKVGA